MMHYGGYGGMYMGFIILVVAIAIIYFVVKRDNSNDRILVPHEETPLDILKRRYAKGEITKEEYDSLKKDIEG